MRRNIPKDRINSSLSASWSLDASEVEVRSIQYGANDIIETHKNRWLELTIDTLKDPMIWFLVATSILFALLKNYNQATILLLATIPLIGMDAYLHWRTQVSTRSLSSSLAAKALVIRNGSELWVPARELVPGDLVVITAGMFFSADGVIVAGNELLVDESTLTGESFPVKKEAISSFATVMPSESIDNHHWGFAGTRLLTGRALLRIIFTGKETLYGEVVTSALHSTQERTPLQQAVAKLVFRLIISASMMCFILALVRYYQGFGIIDSVLSGATLAVAALPDEFPVVFTFFLGVGVYRLAKKNALVRRAVTVENIGRITTICSDKTGTITEGRFQLVNLFPTDQLNSERLLYLAAVASRAESGDLLDLAIFSKIQGSMTVPKRINTFPFTENRKRETSIVAIDSREYLVATKGAPEVIFAISTLASAEKNYWQQRITELGDAGYKVIACAQLLVDKIPGTEPLHQYQFSGVLAFSDPVRKGVAAAINTCRACQIHVLMITGDHPDTARAIASEIGLGDGQPNVVLSEDLDLDHMKNNPDYLRQIDVIARAIPAQKLDIVIALQQSGEIVAVTGDGVNDVPALKAGDIGIAMGGRGTQSAHEAADMILLDDNFDSIVNAISEGRQLFKNLQLSFKYLLLIHMPFVFSAAIIPLLGYPLLYHPIHIVFIELIIHPSSMLVFQDLPPTGPLEVARRRKKILFFSYKDWYMILIAGLFSTLVVILSFVLTYHYGANMEHARTLVMTELGFTSAALILGLARLHTLITRVIIMGTLAFTIILTQIPNVAAVFSFSSLHLVDWLIVVASSLITLLLLVI